MVYKCRANSRKQRGFSLLETMIVIVILMVVLGVATTALVSMQKRNNADSGRIDTTQMARQFMDQVTNDLHQAGYPSAYMFDKTFVANSANANYWAVGMIS